MDSSQKVKEKTEKTNILNKFFIELTDLHYSLHRESVLSVGSSELIPHIIFDYVITTHQFNSTPYFTKQLSDSRIKIQNKVRELHNQGIGYTKIHRYLMENGFEIGKSRTTVDSMIKNIKKRDEFFSQPIIDGYGNFRVEMRG